MSILRKQSYQQRRGKESFVERSEKEGRGAPATDARSRIVGLWGAQRGENLEEGKRRSTAALNRRTNESTLKTGTNVAGIRGMNQKTV